MTTLLHRVPERGLPPAPGPARGPCLGDEARARLRRSGYLALRDVRCDAEAGTLRLRGHLPSYYLKQVAQAVVAEVAGVCRVVNLIEVVAPASRPPEGRDRATTERHRTEEAANAS